MDCNHSISCDSGNSTDTGVPISSDTGADYFHQQSGVSEFVNNSLEIDRILISYPEMRQYVYSDVHIDPEKVDIPRLMSITELLIDVMENIEIFKEQIPKDRIDGWMAFVDAVKNSSAYRMYMDIHGPWYEVIND